MINIENSVQEAFNKYTLGKEAYGLTRVMQDEYKKMLAHCQSTEDKKILLSLFRTVNRGIIRYITPQPTDLSIHEMVRLAELGIKVGCPDRINILANPNGGYNVYQYLDETGDKKIEIFEPHWDDTYSCALNPKSYPEFFNARKKLLKELERIFGSSTQAEVDRKINTLKSVIEEVCYKAVWGFKVPSLDELTHPKPVQIEKSLILTERGKSIDISLSKQSSSTLMAQAKKAIPSLFDSHPSAKLSQNKFQILMLIDSGKSMGEGDIFKLINVACMRAKVSVGKKLAGSEFLFIPYDSKPREALGQIKEFISPQAMSNPAQALRHVFENNIKQGYKPILIHITDSQTPLMNETLETAEELAKCKVPFHQILVGHSAKELAETLYQKNLKKHGQKVVGTNLSQREEDLLKIAKLFGGDQTNCMVSIRLAEALLSAMDLGIGCYLRAEAIKERQMAEEKAAGENKENQKQGPQTISTDQKKEAKANPPKATHPEKKMPLNKDSVGALFGKLKRKNKTTDLKGGQ